MLYLYYIYCPYHACMHAAPILCIASPVYHTLHVWIPFHVIRDDRTDGNASCSLLDEHTHM